MKKILIIAILVLKWNIAFADSEKTNYAYAKINVNAQVSDEQEDTFTEIRGNNSWVGVKGTAPIDDGLTIVYRLEWKVDVSSESGQDNLTERPQYVGLRGKAGEITLGRNFTALWKAQGGIDLFNHYQGDIKDLWQGENRLSDVATYTSPTFNHFSAAVTYQAEKEQDGESAHSVGVFYGDKKFSHSRFFAAIAHDFDVKGYDVTRASLQFKQGNHKLGFMLQEQEPSDTSEFSGADSEFGGLISYALRQKKMDYHFQVQALEDSSSINIGLDYLLSKKSKIFIWYYSLDETVIVETDLEEQQRSNYVAIGFEHKFGKYF